GSYNSNILLELRRMIEAIKAEHPERKLKFYVYGRKGYTWLTRRGYDVERFFVEPVLDKATFDSAKLVGKALVDAWTGGVVDEVRIFYSRFASMIKFVPTALPFLPVSTMAVGDDAKKGQQGDYLLEPDATTVLNQLLPRYLETVVFDSMLQALASEHSSRRMAMKSATDAAVRMNKQLKKVYNRARQENITKELLDIVGGASAVS
ncbi:MAG: hypothetical protein RLZZ562_2260, partial [Planctomycetota bacterium]